MDELTPERIAHNYKAMGDSVWLVNAVINGETMEGAPTAEKTDVVQRNVAHLKLMRAKEYWTDEDFTAVDAAIIAGEAYAG